MPSLLSLPQELRSLIIAQVLFTPRAPPKSPSRANRSNFQDIPYLAWRCFAYHEHCSTHSPSNCLPLLLTSRQISAETLAILDLAADKRSTEYILDIALLNEVDLFPTWLCVPQLTQTVSTLYVGVRLLGHIISGADARNQVGDGGHLGFYWSFYALLERFLAYGPVGEKRVKNAGSGATHDAEVKFRSRWSNPSFTDQNITVDTLVLDVSSAETELAFPPPELDEGDWTAQHYSPPYRYEDEEGYVPLERYKARPEWIAWILDDEIERLLRMGYDRARFVRILYERVRRIRILVEGELLREFRLAEWFDKLRNSSRDDIPAWVREMQLNSD
ncbi:hypothetical protein BDW62DRAFT_135913 [Aspergillus aurantiobrunneus]